MPETKDAFEPRFRLDGVSQSMSLAPFGTALLADPESRTAGLLGSQDAA